jgi:hypothetical protein
MLCCLAFGLLGAGAARAETTINATVTGAAADQTNVIVRVPVSLPMFGFGGRTGPKDPVLVKPQGGDPLPGQLATLGINGPMSFPLGKNDVPGEVVFVLPKLKAGQTLPVSILIGQGTAAKLPVFAWTEKPKESIDLKLGDKPVLQFVCPVLDESTPARREETFKVFHHVYSPDGSQLLTKGAGGFYTHHRGLFYGFMKVTHDGMTTDIWHCKDKAHQSYEGVLSADAGPVLGRHRVHVAWHGKDGKVFAHEQRELTAFAMQGGTMIEFASQLTTDRPMVKIDGDPQHAGFHFRAAQEVADQVNKDKKPQTYYLRPDGKGAIGNTRNWDAKAKDPKTVNLPWDAMSFVVGGKRYTALYLDHPKNPKESRGSERDYGRFGNYFEYDLTPDKPLVVRYRIWVQEGEMTGEQCEAMSKAFTDPPAVKVAAK